jgi:hypothetical protein
VLISGFLEEEQNHGTFICFETVCEEVSISKACGCSQAVKENAKQTCKKRERGGTCRRRMLRTAFADMYIESDLLDKHRKS